MNERELRIKPVGASTNVEASPVRVLVAGHSEIFCSGLSGILSQFEDINVLGCVKSTEDLLSYELERAQVILVETGMLETDNATFLRDMYGRNPHCKVILWGEQQLLTDASGLSSFDGYFTVTSRCNQVAELVRQSAKTASIGPLSPLEIDSQNRKRSSLLHRLEDPHKTTALPDLPTNIADEILRLDWDPLEEAAKPDTDGNEEQQFEELDFGPVPEPQTIPDPSLAVTQSRLSAIRPRSYGTRRVRRRRRRVARIDYTTPLQWVLAGAAFVFLSATVVAAMALPFMAEDNSFYDQYHEALSRYQSTLIQRYRGTSFFLFPCG